RGHVDEQLVRLERLEVIGRRDARRCERGERDWVGMVAEAAPVRLEIRGALVLRATARPFVPKRETFVVTAEFVVQRHSYTNPIVVWRVRIVVREQRADLIGCRADRLGQLLAQRSQ